MKTTTCAWCVHAVRLMTRFDQSALTVQVCLPQRHPFFNGVDWEHLYSTQPPFRPSVAHELDTQVRSALT